MSRTLKRVPLDFDWPRGKTWDGYLNPHLAEQQQCPGCQYGERFGCGYSPAGRLLSDLWYASLYAERAVMLVSEHMKSVPAELVKFAIVTLKSRRSWSDQLDQQDVDALVDGGRLWDFTRRQLRPDQETHPNGWTKEPNGYRPTADEVNRWNSQGMGHDSINSMICIRATAERYGIDGTCPDCNGNGTVPNPELEARIDAWTKTEPPEGEGYQLWQTVSEGSPISPVFRTLDQLCRRAAAGHATTFGYDTATADQWRKMLEEDFVHSRVGNNIFM